MQNTLEEQRRINERLSALRNPAEKGICLLFIGVTIHWIAMVCHNLHSKIEFVVLDPQNVSLQALLDKNFDQIKKEKRQHLESDDEGDAKEEELNLSAYTDRANVIELVRKVLITLVLAAVSPSIAWLVF